MVASLLTTASWLSLSPPHTRAPFANAPPLPHSLGRLCETPRPRACAPPEYGVPRDMRSPSQSLRTILRHIKRPPTSPNDALLSEKWSTDRDAMARIVRVQFQANRGIEQPRYYNQCRAVASDYADLLEAVDEKMVRLLALVLAPPTSASHDPGLDGGMEQDERDDGARAQCLGRQTSGTVHG